MFLDETRVRGQEPNAITKALATREPCSCVRCRRDERWTTAGEGLLSQFATFLDFLVLLDFCQIFFKPFFVRENRSVIRFDSSPFASVREALLRLQQVF